MIVSEIAKQSLDFLQKKKIPGARMASEEMLCHVLSMTRMEIYLDFERPLTQKEIESCREILKRLSTGEPIQQILGCVQFYEAELKITPDVLIPRPETELLVDKIVKELNGRDLASKTLWDVCCGSGCIGIALKKALPDLKVTLSDLSPKALAVARENAQKNGVDVTFVEGSLLEPFEGSLVDFLVVNPPYISDWDFEQLDSSVKDFEPHLALRGGCDGLDFYRALARNYKQFLKPGAMVWLELGTGQGDLVNELFEGKGVVEKDWSGHDRFFSLEIG